MFEFFTILGVGAVIITALFVWLYSGDEYLRDTRESLTEAALSKLGVKE